MPASPLAGSTAASAACSSAPVAASAAVPSAPAAPLASVMERKTSPVRSLKTPKLPVAVPSDREIADFFEGCAKETREAEVTELKRMKAEKAKLKVEMQDRKRKIRELDNVDDKNKEDAGKKEKKKEERKGGKSKGRGEKLQA